MAYSKTTPAGLLKLSETARRSALEISEALQSAGVEETKSLRIAIATAKHLEGTDVHVVDFYEDDA